MLSFASTFFLALAPQGESAITPVVINEFSYDDTLTDDREFVELYNASGAPVDISGWVLDSEDPSGSNTAYTIPAATILAPGQFWVLGSALVPNVDQVVGTTNIWENSNESLTLRDASTAIIDTLVYEAWRGVWDPTLAEGEGVWGNFASIDGTETSWSRLRDGFDTDDNGRDFRVVPHTPGASNNLASALPLFDNFNGGTPGDAVASFGATFKPPRVIDPTVVDTYNPNAISASPDGGNAALFWDETGGGNVNMLLTDATDGISIEAWVYLDATPEPVGEREIWTIGVQGTTGTFYNHPDPSGTLGFTSNGNTGIGWTYEVLETGATLYLVDHNNGGTDITVLGQITISPGVNDGWQRLRLRVTDCTAFGNFGGTYGMNDGTVISGVINGAIGGVYVGYREFVANNASVRPVTLDALRIDTTTSVAGSVANIGPGCPGSTGRTASVGGLNGSVPAVGLPFQILLSNAPANTALSFVMIAVNSLGGLPLDPIGMPTCLLFTDPLVALPAPTDALGDGITAIDVPPTAELVGNAFLMQGFIADPAANAFGAILSNAASGVVGCPNM